MKNVMYFIYEKFYLNNASYDIIYHTVNVIMNENN